MAELTMAELTMMADPLRLPTPVQIMWEEYRRGHRIPPPAFTFPFDSYRTSWCPVALPDQHLRLDGLNNDVLAIIIDFVSEIELVRTIDYHHTPVPARPLVPTHPKDPKYRPFGSAIFALSLTNKRMRAFSIRKLFRHVSRTAGYMLELNKCLKHIEGRPWLLALPAVLPAVKFVTLGGVAPPATNHTY